MPMSTFPYLGGKTRLAPWIIDHLPGHQTYVEAFGGSASVLLNKPESKIEVYNDINDDLVQFFRVARERPDELEEWLRRVPYSRDIHDRWVSEYYDGHRPNDPVERAGRFFFLRFSQFAAKINSPSGFKAAKNSNPASAFDSGRNQINEVADRFGNVIIENRDWSEVVDSYDDEDTAFYFDPPYLDCESYYDAAGFSHADFAAELEKVDGYWIVSYEKVPEAFQSSDYWVVEKETSWKARATKYGGEKEATERLLMNFDPEAVPEFVDSQQQTLTEEIA